MKTKSILIAALVASALGVAVHFGRQSRSVQAPGQSTANTQGRPNTAHSRAKGLESIGVTDIALSGSFNWGAITSFNAWAVEWKGATPEQREAMKAEGVRMARARRPEFKKLIVADPERALEQAVRPVIRQALPPEIVDKTAAKYREALDRLTGA